MNDFKMKRDIFKNLKNLKLTAEHIQVKKQNAELEKTRKVKSAKGIKKTLKVSKSELESQIFCNDGHYLSVILLELNNYYAISKKVDMAIIVDLDYIDPKIKEALIETITKKRHSNLKLKQSITEALLLYLQQNNLMSAMTSFNLNSEEIIDSKLLDIISIHNLKESV